MAFDFSTLITDRTLADVQQGTDKGFYNATDLNRVDAALEDLAARFRGYGYAVPGYQRIKINHAATGRLPDGYTELEYIESSGTQYIDTGFKPNQDTRLAAKIKLLNNKVAAWAFGARATTTTQMFVFTASASGYYSTDYGATKQSYDTTLAFTDAFTIDKNKNVTTLNGENVKTNTAATFSCPGNLVLFGVNTNGTISKSTATFYACQIYDNGEKIRDFVPCRNPSGAIGLYDTVGEQFYGNAGTGTFTAGLPKVKLPSGYTQLTYIQSSGTQYVDTGFKPNNNTRVVIDTQFLATPSGNAALFGARTTATSKNYAMLFIPPSFRADYNNVYSQTWAVTATTRRVYDKNKETTTIDGTAKSYTNSSFQADYTLTLAAINAAGTVQWFSTLRIYACQVYDNGTLIRDYIPCTNADDTVGLYDVVNGQFYANNGTGSFTAGDTVTWPEETENDPYTWYEADVPTAGQMETYRGNIASLRAVIAMMTSTPETPESMRALNYVKANDIERILQDLDTLITNMEQVWFFSGDLYAGET